MGKEKSLSVQQKGLRDQLARAEARSGVLRLPRDVVLKMSDGEFRLYLDKRLSALFDAVSTIERRRTKEVCEETIAIHKGEKFWGSSTLLREIDREFFRWVLHVVDPTLVWTPPFTHSKIWRTFIESRVVTKEFVFYKKVQNDLRRFWIMARDRRDTLDQKKMRLARAASKSYGTALHAIRRPCLTEFISLEEFTPELCWPKFAARVVVSTGFQKSMTAWLSEVAVQLNSSGLQTLQLILEAAIQKTGKDMRQDFAIIYKQAKEARELKHEQESYATQGNTQFDWSFL